MNIDEKRIREIYGSAAAFCDRYRFNIGQYNMIKNKKTDIFHSKSKTFSLYQIMKKEGLIL